MIIFTSSLFYWAAEGLGKTDKYTQKYMSFYRINIYFAIFCLCIIYIEGAQKKQIQQKHLTMYFSIANLHKLFIIFIQQW